MPKVLTQRFKKALKRHTKKHPQIILKKTHLEPHVFINFVQHRFRDRFFRILRFRGRILEAFWVHKWPHDASKGASRAPKWDPGASKIHQKIGLGPPWLPRGGPRGLRGTPPTPIFMKNHKKYDQILTENVQNPRAKQCKLTFKNEMKMHLQLHSFFFCEAKCKGSVTAAGWAKPTRINSLKS